MTCSYFHPCMQLSALFDTSFAGSEALDESEVFHGGVVSAPDHMTLHKVSMQNCYWDACYCSSYVELSMAARDLCR